MEKIDEYWKCILIGGGKGLQFFSATKTLTVLYSLRSKQQVVPSLEELLRSLVFAWHQRYDKKIEEKWVAFEKRMQRWQARQQGGKLNRLTPFSYDYQGRDSLMKNLNDQHGILSDGFVHFTPEYYASQNWRVKETDAQRNTVELLYFISDQKTLECELILLADNHAQILNVINHCVDYILLRTNSGRASQRSLLRTVANLENYLHTLGEQMGRA